MEIKLPDLLAFFSLMSAWIGIFDWNIVLILRAGKAITIFSTRENSLLFFPNCSPKERESRRAALQKAPIGLALLSNTGSRKQLLCSCSSAQPHTAPAWASCIISIHMTQGWKWKVSLIHGSSQWHPAFRVIVGSCMLQVWAPNHWHRQRCWDLKEFCKGSRSRVRFPCAITGCFAENTAWWVPVLKLQFPTSLSLSCLKG